MTEGGREDEWGKLITAKLRASAQLILIDNLRGRLDSSKLAAAITSPVWEDRILGLSEMVRIPVRAIWVATGNNPGLSNEMARRTVRIRLDARRDRPWERREFRHPELLAWVRENRARLVWAALTLAQAWVAAGRPPAERASTLGMFERWCAVLGGILDHVGIPGFLGNLGEFYDDADAEGQDWRAFVSAWWREHGDKPVQMGALWETACRVEPSPNLGDGSEKSQRIRLGKLLRSMRDRHFTIDPGYGAPFETQIMAAGTYNGSQQWRLIASV
ncbi:hypothetical protein CHT98_32935 (plasmid) [Azospirillum brasilense]|uniref:Uncharacterized protein n=1 Tax=Azospirillum brasilense TaxID=192 RepID=A0A235H2R8_AZOBR|nr:hypothetical protein CHT98_32935 [Azospirillum brasilense]